MSDPSRDCVRFLQTVADLIHTARPDATKQFCRVALGGSKVGINRRTCNREVAGSSPGLTIQTFLWRPRCDRMLPLLYQLVIITYLYAHAVWTFVFVTLHFSSFHVLQISMNEDVYYFDRRETTTNDD